MCAVLHNFDEYNFESFPTTYCQSPFFCLDLEWADQGAIQHTEAQVDNILENDDYQNTNDISALPVTPQVAIKKSRLNLVSLCERLRDMAYICQDKNVLDDASTELQNLVANFDQQLPKSNHLNVQSGSMTGIGTRSKRKQLPKSNHLNVQSGSMTGICTRSKRKLEKKPHEKSPVQPPKLPKLPPKKPGSQRHGQKAETDRANSKLKTPEVSTAIAVDQGRFKFSITLTLPSTYKLFSVCSDH